MVPAILFKQFLIKGTCYTTQGGRRRHRVRRAGEGNGLTIILMMEKTNALNYNIKMTSPELEGSKGVYFAVSNDQMGIASALNIQGQSVEPGINLFIIYHNPFSRLKVHIQQLF